MNIDYDKIVEKCYHVAKDSISEFTLPVGDTLMPAWCISFLLLVIDTVCALLGVYVFISPLGALLCFIILSIIVYLERSTNDGVIKAVGVVQSRIASLRSRKAKSSRNKQTNRRIDVSDVDNEEIIP